MVRIGLRSKMIDFELTDDEIAELKRITHKEAITDTEWYIDRLCPKVAQAAQRKLVERQERMFNRLISAQSRKELLESLEWNELRKVVGLESWRR